MWQPKRFANCILLKTFFFQLIYSSSHCSSLDNVIDDSFAMKVDLQKLNSEF